MKLRVGVVGLGNAWESRHRLALRSLSDRYDVRAFFCDVATRAEQAAREFEAGTVDGYHALTCRADVDAVLVLSTSWSGALPILAACDAGKAVYCATPLDLGTERLRELTERIDQSGVAFMAELPRRHAPATLRLKELMATQLGKPQLVFCHQRHAVRPQPNATTARDLVELVDWCRYVIGSEPTSVVGVDHRRDDGTCDYEMMSLDFGGSDSSNVPVAQISVGEYIRPAWQDASSFRVPSGMQVACENGVAFIDLPATLIWFDEAGQHIESLEQERPVGEQLLNQFHRAVTSLVRTSDLEDAYRSVVALQTARRSSEEGRRLAIEY